MTVNTLPVVTLRDINVKRSFALPNVGNDPAPKRQKKEVNTSKVSRFNFNEQILKLSLLKPTVTISKKTGEQKIRVAQENFKEVIEILEAKELIISKVWLDEKLEQNQFVSLLDAMKSNSGVTKFTIKTKLQPFLWTTDLANWLKENSNLIFLKIENGYLSSEATSELARGLQENTTLKSLNLYNNSIGDSGAEAIAEALINNPSLTHLYLSMNDISDQGVEKITDLLIANPNIIELDLSLNYIELKENEKFTDFIRTSTSLTFLDLSGNPIYESLEGVVDVFAENRSITHLKLIYHSKSLKAVSKIIEKNKSLISIDLADSYSANKEDDHLVAELVESINKNMHLRIFEFKTSDELRILINAKLLANIEYFNSMVNVIENPGSYNQDILQLNVNVGHCKFFDETQESLFHQALGTKYSEFLTNFKNVVSLAFFNISNVCKGKYSLPLPCDIIFNVIMPHLKVGDISWSHDSSVNGAELKPAESTVLGLNEGFEA